MSEPARGEKNEILCVGGLYVEGEEAARFQAACGAGDEPLQIAEIDENPWQR